MRSFTLLASALVAAGAAMAQTAQDVTNSVYQIGNTTQLLLSDTQQINATQQGIPWALQIQQDAVYLYRLVNNGTVAANASSVWDGNDSFLVATSLLNITDTVKYSLGNLSSKVNIISGLGPVVLGSLYQLKTATDQFANATIAKLSSAYQGVAPNIKQDLDTAFNNAIQTYGGKPLGG